MRTRRDWSRLVRQLDAHAEMAQHDLDTERYREAHAVAVDLSAYVGAAPEGLLDEAFDRLYACGLMPAREDMDVVAVLAAQIHNTQEVAA